MDQAKCSCDKFERLEGASVPAYIAAFLEEGNPDAHSKKKRFRCRTCGREWERREPPAKSEGKRALLFRLS
jgi:hypothetical protein